MTSKTTIGLFGTCGSSLWRDPFIKRYDALHISYFNPKVDNWTPECATAEAEHLAIDQIILFPITGETYGFGSLAETGFSVIQAVKNVDRYTIVLVDDLKIELIEADPVQAKESKRARALVKAHLSTIQNPNVIMVSCLADMLSLSCELADITRYKNAAISNWQAK